MGGNTCSICKSEAKEAVDRALVAGSSLRDIAGQYGLSKSALDRHQVNHLSATLVKVVEAQDDAHGGRLLEQAQGLVNEALASIERSKSAGKEKEVLGGIREARHSLARIPHLAQTSDAVNRQLSCFSSRYMNLLAVFQI